MDRLDIPIKVYPFPNPAEPDCWMWKTVRLYHGKRFYVLVPFPSAEALAHPQAVACLFENAYQTLAYMTENNCEVD